MTTSEYPYNPKRYTDGSEFVPLPFWQRLSKYDRMYNELIAAIKEGHTVKMDYLTRVTFEREKSKMSPEQRARFYALFPLIDRHFGYR